jgi:N-acetylmuramoyl-L-alanine amidase
VRALLGVGLALTLGGGFAWIGQPAGPAERPPVQAFLAPPSEPLDELEAPAADSGDPASALPVAALITPSGIIVPAFGQVGDTYIVHTPCGVLSDVTGGVPLYRADVVLDPGHGGDVETGAQGANGLVEKDLNMAVAITARRILERRGIVTVLDRTGDYRLPLATRAEIGNRLGARLMISIHHNAPTPGRSASPGTEVYFQHDSDASARLGRLVWEEVVDALSEFDGVSWVAAPDAGALPVLDVDGDDTYGMVRRPQMPAVLAELGYISNPSEAELFSTTNYVDAAAEALATAVERFLDTDDEGEAPMPEPRVFTPDGRTGHARDCVDPELD